MSHYDNYNLPFLSQAPLLMHRQELKAKQLVWAKVVSWGKHCLKGKKQLSNKENETKCDVTGWIIWFMNGIKVDQIKKNAEDYWLSKYENVPIDRTSFYIRSIPN